MYLPIMVIQKPSWAQLGTMCSTSPAVSTDQNIGVKPQNPKES